MNEQPYDWDGRYRIYKGQTDAQLEWALKDIREARDIAEDFERQGLPNKAGFYADEIHTVVKVMNERKAKAAKRGRR